MNKKRTRLSSTTRSRSSLRALVLVCISALLAISVHKGGAQTSHGQRAYEPELVWKITMTDREWIDNFLRDQLLFFPDTVAKVEIFDLERNGFGINDVAIMIPQQIPHLLTELGDDLKEEMAAWDIAENLDITEDRYAGPDTVELMGMPQYGMLASTLRGINRNYHDTPIRLFFERDTTKVRLLVWGYNLDSLRYVPPDIHETGYGGYDLYHVMRSDTIVVADTTMYDVIYVYRTYGDTVFLPSSSRVSRYDEKK